MIYAMFESSIKNLVIRELRPKHPIEYERLAPLINSPVLVILHEYDVVLDADHLPILLVLLINFEQVLLDGTLDSR